MTTYTTADTIASGHLQTLYCVFGDFSKNDHMWYDRQVSLHYHFAMKFMQLYRKMLRLVDGGTLYVQIQYLCSAF
jgi:hypothetical protein